MVNHPNRHKSHAYWVRRAKDMYRMFDDLSLTRHPDAYRFQHLAHLYMARAMGVA